MNRFFILVFCLFLYANSVWSQKKEPGLLINKKWVLQSDEMKGLGTHLSLAEHTELEFLDNGTWKSSEPIKGSSDGKWTLLNNSQSLSMDFREEQVNFLILDLSEKSLKLRHKKNAATFIYTWAVE